MKRKRKDVVVASSYAKGYRWLKNEEARHSGTLFNTHSTDV